MTDVLGVDINGLVDSFAIGDLALRNISVQVGEVPSVVVTPHADHGGAVGGVEATLALHGRGWQHPPSAGHHPEAMSRIPLSIVLHRLVDRATVPTANGPMQPAELAAVACRELAKMAFLSYKNDAAGSAENIIVAMPDDGQFDTDLQQRLLEAFAGKNLHAALLWRSIAVFLGCEHLLLPLASRLNGKGVGVVCLQADSIAISRLDVELKGGHLVPVRKQAGLRLPLDKSIHECAEELAKSLLPGDPQGAWQALWGNGLALRRLIGLPTKPALVQVGGRWRRITDESAVSFATPTLTTDMFAEARERLKGCPLVLIEGPACEARWNAKEIYYYKLTDALDLPPSTQRTMVQRSLYAAAKGGVVYAFRVASGQPTYYDFLPQLRIAVRVGANAAFIDLIPPQERAEGGKTWTREFDLNLMVKEGQQRLEVFLRRADDAVRKASVTFPLPAAVQTGVKIGITQRPAQGYASLTLIFEPESEVPAIALTWDTMTVDGRTEEQILEYLDEAGTKIPPVTPIKTHWEGWKPAVVDVLKRLNAKLGTGGAPLKDCIVNLNSLGFFIGKAGYVEVSANPGIPNVYYRLIDENGGLPTEGMPYPGADEIYRQTLALLNGAMSGANLDLNSSFRIAVVRTLSKFHAACPDLLKAHLLRLAKSKLLVYVTQDCRAMGRVFTTPDEWKAFYGLLASEPTLKQHHLLALSDILLTRKNAASHLDRKLAENFCVKILARLGELKDKERSRRYSRGKKLRWQIGNSCLKALIGLLRYRQANPAFLAPGSDPLAQKFEAAIEAILASDKLADAAKTYAAPALKYLHEQGVADELLSLINAEDPDEDGDGDGDGGGPGG
ncbi:MAG: hypothetical protein WCJ64_05050 [Rhodospirillaceae bacterium]